eukprot:CAMPEP_0176134538 /NCGR_PEP_ID=MMETSP0120_2-20121206/68229_1 /TAXON_ID=160619 /ORGANISM="Kryptoperidinium foliaceum, Strain CCMP 1326" /LENGTH=59 /DNA_ID=CAMNT_0017470191 /DNA_START=46 /DNA_END=221 /DNA_ORIENTATION=-
MPDGEALVPPLRLPFVAASTPGSGAPRVQSKASSAASAAASAIGGGLVLDAGEESFLSG